MLTTMLAHKACLIEIYIIVNEREVNIDMTTFGEKLYDKIVFNIWWLFRVWLNDFVLNYIMLMSLLLSLIFIYIILSSIIFRYSFIIRKLFILNRGNVYT